MKPIEVPALDDERIMVPFVVPIPGREPLEFSLPRRDFTPYEDVKTMAWLAAEFDHDKAKLAEWVDPDEPDAGPKAWVLLSIRPYVDDETFEVLRSQAFGRLRFINDQVMKFSTVTLGESWASADSPRASTGRPSKPTSSTAATGGGTSATG